MYLCLNPGLWKSCTWALWLLGIWPLHRSSESFSSHQSSRTGTCWNFGHFSSQGFVTAQRTFLRFWIWKHWPTPLPLGSRIESLHDWFPFEDSWHPCIVRPGNFQIGLQQNLDYSHSQISRFRFWSFQKYSQRPLRNFLSQGVAFAPRARSCN